MKIKREYVLNLGIELLEGKKVVYNPYNASKQYGGCTQEKGIYYANYSDNKDLNIPFNKKCDVKIYIPNDYNGEHIDVNVVNAIKKTTINKLCDINKKATYKGEQLAKGYWVMNSGELVEEKIEQLLFENIKIDKNSLNLITSIANYLRVALNQEAISVEINNQLLIV